VVGGFTQTAADTKICRLSSPRDLAKGRFKGIVFYDGNSCGSKGVSDCVKPDT
jgi:hypothetical protein